MALNDKDGGFSNSAVAGPYDAEAPPLNDKYGAPPQYYNAPPQQYGAPPQQYGAPPQQYGAPPQQYGGNKPPPYVTSQPQYGQQTSNTTVVTTGYGPSAYVMAQPVREAGPAPTTGCSLALAILSIFFCVGGWPFAVVSIIFNRKANGYVQLGQYTTARSSLRTAYIFLVVAVVVGIIGWAIFAVRLKAALDDYERLERLRNNYYYSG